MKQKWTVEQISQLFALPFNELLFQAHTVYRQHHEVGKLQLSSLLNIKTGACPEDCAYCPQSGHYSTGIEKEKLMSVEDIVAKAKLAREKGATRFCMGAAWRNPPAKHMPKIVEIIKAIKALGMETCMTLGMLSDEQVDTLQDAGLDYYNHNLDTSPEFYKKIISTRTYDERIDTLTKVDAAGIKMCCGGIMGMGESRDDRVQFLYQLASLPQLPQSVPINRLVPIKGTPLEAAPQIDNIEFIRTIAVARIMFPTSYVRLSAGRETMSDEMHALCFFAGANSIFWGDKLLMTKNPENEHDWQLLNKLDMNPVLSSQAKQQQAEHNSTVGS